MTAIVGRRAAAAVAGAALAVLAVIGPATTALADDSLQVRIDEPAVDGTRATVSGSAEMSDTLGLHLDRVTAISITVTSRQHPGTTTSCGSCAAGLDQQSASFSFTATDLNYNGPYDVTVDASGRRFLDVFNSAPVSTRATTSFSVEVAPAPPANVKAIANPDRSVTVSWARNAEPDLVGYQVQRRGPSTPGFQTVASSVNQPPNGSTVNWTDTTTASTGGQFGYLVVAIRPDGDGVVSNRATSASAAAAVTVPGPPGGPSTTGPGGTGANGPGGPAGIATPGPGGAFTTGSPAPLDLSSFLATGGAPPKIAVPGGVALPDGSFTATLPFGPKSASGAAADSVEILGHSTSRRALLLPVATGLLMCVFALHLRRFNRQVLAQPLEH